MFLNPEQVNANIKEVKKQIEKIREESNNLKKINAKYRKEIDDQISEDTNKLVDKINADAEKLYEDLLEKNEKLKRANKGMIESESKRIEI